MPTLTVTKPSSSTSGARKPIPAPPPAPNYHGPRSRTAEDGFLGRKIKLRRIELGISQQEVGKKLGISFQQVQKYEKGTNRVGAARLQQIASALDVPVTFFYEGGTIKSREVESLLYTDSAFALRLLRAYAAIKSKPVQRSLVALMEAIAGTAE